MRPRGERISRLAKEVGEDFINWLHEQVNRQALLISDLPEVMFTVHPCARLVAAPFLSLMISENVEKNLLGKVMTDIIKSISGQPKFQSDDDRLRHVREQLLESGERYIRDDFSSMVGEGDFLEFKKQVARTSVQGLHSKEDLERALDKGIAVMRPHLDLAAQEMRRLSAYPLSIFLTDSSSIDDPAAVRRMADTVGALEALKSINGVTH